jgi:hypothetical protein
LGSQPKLALHQKFAKLTPFLNTQLGDVDSTNGMPLTGALNRRRLFSIALAR